MSREMMDVSAEQFESASPQAQAVLQRIRQQRERLYSRRLAHEQAMALRRENGPDYGLTHGSLAMRALAFGKLHPMVCAAGAGVALLVGPRKLLRLASIAMPLLMKLRRSSAG